ncbi:UDP-glucose:glycoprotein glucosyltransferase [Termitomyces sp. J132]|nr:UDP-glucose:glycoprotein glucosyltransferase [Termitomyces sp. J132]
MRRSLQLLGLSLAVVGGRCASPPVEVLLRSSWPASPPLIEILETIALENPDTFFPLLDKLTDPDVLPTPEKLTPEAAHQAVMEIAAVNGYLTEPGSLAAVELNLALHAATPKIEAFYNHYLDHHNNTKGTDCGSWIEWYGEVVCDIEQLVKLAGVDTIDPTTKPVSSPFPRPRLLTFDHIYPSPAHTLNRPPRTAILYALLSSSNFRELHNYLLSLASKPNPHVEYVLRYVPAKRDASVRNFLSGYGVSLNLKKTDYLAIDDRNTRNGANGQGTVERDESVVTEDPVLALIHNHPENATAPSAKTPLTVEENLNLSFQAIQLVADSPTPLQTLKHLTQNFPKYAPTLARRVVVNESLSSEIYANSLKIQGGGHMFWLNGAMVPDRDVNPFGLLRWLKKERSLIGSLTGEVGLSRKEAFELLTSPEVAGSQGNGVLDGIVDASDRIEGGGVVVYWNDMEKDSRYERWSTSVFTLIQPVYHGIPSVKYNVFNIILVLDLSQMDGLAFIAGNMANLISRGIPLRFGVVPITETEDSTRMARLFSHLISTHGRKKTLKFIQDFIQAQPVEKTTVDWVVLSRTYTDLAESEGSGTHVTSLEDILSGKADPGTLLDKVRDYVERLDVRLEATTTGHVFFNGRHFSFDQDFMRNMQSELSKQMHFLQEKIYTGKLTEAHNETLGTYFYDQPTTGIRRNQYIFQTDAPGSLKVYNLPELFARMRFRVVPATFVYPACTVAESPIIPLSLFVIADLDSQEGLKLVEEALLSIVRFLYMLHFAPDDEYHVSQGLNTRTRISFIHNPIDDPTERTDRPLASWLIAYLIKTQSLSKASPEQLLRALDFSGKEYGEYVITSRLVARELDVKPGERAVLVNGRVVGPFVGGNFRAVDFAALENYEIRKRVEPVMNALETISPSASQTDRATYANLISMASSAIAAIQIPDPSEVGLFQTPQRPRNRQYQLLDSQYTAFEAGDHSMALFHIAVVMDPLSVVGQKWSSLLEWLANVPEMFIEIHLNPGHHIEMPLKTFYRYNLLSSLSYQENGQEVAAQTVFEGLPIKPLYTLAMDVPLSWLVRPREALYDLDNIQLVNLSPEDHSLKAVFDLDYLVVEGHAREVHNNNAPRGVQLELLRGGQEPYAVDDTQVVANLGYFQFKVKPGVFGLEIRMGRGRDVYRMESVGNEGWNSPTIHEKGSEITLTSFEGLTLYPTLTRKPGMDNVDVLTHPERENNFSSILGDLTSRVTSLFKPKGNVPHGEEQAEINIFTVASGLLYERFVSIMILSVLRNTQSTVKFWFIENFLSPSFLEFIPHLAKQYNFKYELVTYKWPSWLREQTEKQRIIWAYKILFLDVLFPMDLKKVIFVDADQIVRADLKELVDLDLHGAPYGYTPMGDDNPDMEGFRFWKTGYWKDFLRGLSYHISALYVIDLDRFRQLAAGDILRGHYQQLSADPNSLANLDQDLPNNLQREVPIYSLHEDWLWCETWCNKDRLHRAKTIDLCQNPLTKEPKLDRARQIPEWEEYDREIAQFTRQLADAGVIHSGLATADTNVLANAGTTQQENFEPSHSEPEGFPVRSSVPERDEL